MCLIEDLKGRAYIVVIITLTSRLAHSQPRCGEKDHCLLFSSLEMTKTRCSRAVVMVKIQLVWHKLDEVGVCNSVLYSIEKVEDIGQKIL